jgi:hypothetical protein
VQLRSSGWQQFVVDPFAAEAFAAQGARIQAMKWKMTQQEGAIASAKRPYARRHVSQARPLAALENTCGRTVWILGQVLGKICRIVAVLMPRLVVV